jgi:hypothetical protein
VDHVILVFSATESRSFSGYGKMTGEPDDFLFPGIWGELSCRLSASFRVHWIKQCAAPMSHADHIRNPQNDDLPVRRGRDGQELPSSVGERLCRFLWQQPYADLLKDSGLELEPRARYDAPLPALKDAEPPPSGDAGNAGHSGAKGKSQSSAGPAPVEEVDERARPAPVPLGTFQREVKNGKGRGHAPVAVGKALASGSSSLLAAMAEEGHQMGGGRWQPPPPTGWQPPPLDRPPHPGAPPQGWMPQRLPPPPVGYYGPPHHEPWRGYPYPHGGCPPPGPYGEAHTPGFWGGGGEVPRSHFARPPSEWEGASSAAVPLTTRGRSEDPGRSRSRGKRNRHKRRRS